MSYIKSYKTFEDIKVPINIGDVVLGGRFKNKKMVVKKIGKNKKGDITINDKPLLKFRLVKENLKEDVDNYFSHLSDDGFVIFASEDYIRIFKPVSEKTVYTYSNCSNFEWSEISDDIARYINILGLKNNENSEKSIDYCYVMKINSTSDIWSSKSRVQIPFESLIDESFDTGGILSFTIGFK